MSARQAARWKRAACPALARDSFSKSKIWRRNRGFGFQLGELRLSKPLREGAGERPGDMRRGVLQAAFLAPQGRSKRLCGVGCGAGAGARRERWARRRAFRDGSGRTRRGFRRGGDAWRGVMCRCLPQAAFLVSRLLNHSRFPDGRKYRRSVRCRAQPLYLLTPAGRFALRATAHRAHASLRAFGHSKRLRGAGCRAGAGARRERWARRRACRGGSGRTRRGF